MKGDLKGELRGNDMMYFRVLKANFILQIFNIFNFTLKHLILTQLVIQKLDFI